jgi:cysteine-rich repeat protein
VKRAWTRLRLLAFLAAVAAAPACQPLGVLIIGPPLGDDDTAIGDDDTAIGDDDTTAGDDDTGDDDTGDDDTGDDDAGDDDAGDDDAGDDDAGDDDVGDDDAGDDDAGDDDAGDDDAGDDDAGDDDTGDDDTAGPPCDDDDSAAGPGGTTTPCVSICGDSVIECSEECDDGPLNSDIEPGWCRTTCLLPHCGDGVVDAVVGELCDDGNTSGCDGCSPACLPEAGAACGDGFLDLGEGELCDDGGTVSGDGCSAACRPEPLGGNCGDGQSLPPELCDDGNLSGGDTCNPTCNLENRSTVFAGMAGQPGYVDEMGSLARLGGGGVLLALNDYLYFGDSSNHTVRRIHIGSAMITTLAGSGVAGFADHPLGAMASFGSIDGLASDGTTLWVSDRSNGRLRTIDLSPCSASHCFTVATVAGSGLGVHQDGYGVSAGFAQMGGIAWQGGLVYIVDEGSSSLRTFDPNSGEVRTVAGTPYVDGHVDDYGTAGLLDGPRSVLLGVDGTLFLGDSGGNRIRTWNPALGYLGTFAGNGGECHVDGAAAAASIPSATGMTSDGTSLYWADSEQHTVRQALLSDGEISTLLGRPCSGCDSAGCSSCAPCAGSHALAVGSSARLNTPSDVAFHFPSNSLFVLDGGNAIILRVR